jgi:biopolymer transport protein ExbD
MKKKMFLFILIIFITISFMSLIGCNNQNPPKAQSSVTEKSSSDWVKYRVEDNGTVHSYKKGKIEKNRRHIIGNLL